MRRVYITLALVAALAGCGEESADYCSPAKVDQIAALELSDGDTINDPRRLRRGTDRLLSLSRDAPQDAYCVDQEVQLLVDVWNSSRGEPGWGDAANQVRRLRRFQMR